MVNKACAGPGDPYLDDPSLGKTSDQYSCLNHGFARLHVSDIGNNAQDECIFEYGPRGLSATVSRVNGSGFFCPQQKKFGVSSIPAHLAPETIRALYGLQDAAKIAEAEHGEHPTAN